jgi:nucleotide-binding universal stress UspA family protein
MGVNRRRRRPSEEAKAALRFALAEAKLRHASLRAVHSSHFDDIGPPGIKGFDPGTAADLGEVHKWSALVGMGGFTGLLLGSVGQQCAHDATCPTVIIPHRREK